jgi:hypothetical protein
VFNKLKRGAQRRDKANRMKKIRGAIREREGKGSEEGI